VSFAKGKSIFRYRLSPVTFGYTLVCCVIRNAAHGPAINDKAGTIKQI
jgi:hypothetical protein